MYPCRYIRTCTCTCTGSTIQHARYPVLPVALAFLYKPSLFHLLKTIIVPVLTGIINTTNCKHLYTKCMERMMKLVAVSLFQTFTCRCTVHVIYKWLMKVYTCTMYMYMYMYMYMSLQPANMRKYIYSLLYLVNQNCIAS